MKGAPPYSCTRVRTLAGGDVTGAATPLSKLNSDTAPPAAGTFSVQYRRPLTLRRSPKLIPPAARASALSGEAQEPYGASIGAGEAVAGAVVAGAAECDVIAANRPKRTQPTRGAAANADRAMVSTATGN